MGYAGNDCNPFYLAEMDSHTMDPMRACNIMPDSKATFYQGTDSEACWHIPFTALCI